MKTIFNTPSSSSKTQLVLTFILFIFIANTSYGIHRYVTNTNGVGPGSLRNQIAASISGDTVYINVSGTLTVASQLNIPHDLVIIGPGAIHFTIDGSSLTGLDAMMSPGNTGTLQLDGISFKNGGKAAIGTNSGYTGLMVVSNCLFENINNTAVAVDGGNVEFEGCSFFNNTSANEAGACLLSGSTAKFTNCTFFQNEASFDGGAIQASSGSVDIVHCTFYENGIGMAAAANGKAIYINGANVNMRNNLIIKNNGTGPDDRIIDINAGSLNSLGGNVTTDPNGGEWTDHPSDLTAVSVILANQVVDGWGLKYFPYADDFTPGVNIDQTPTGLPLYDQRRVWRIMDDGSFNEFADAGAVEYTPLTVTLSGGTTLGTLEGNFLTVYPTLFGKKAFVFEISGPGPYSCPTGIPSFVLSDPETIINGFSQNGSRVPGPGILSSNVTSAITQIVINKVLATLLDGITVSADNCVIAGVSIIDYDIGGVGIKNNAYFTEISGCHIGVTENGTSQSSNDYGIQVGVSGSAKIGSGTYCGHLYHSNRNVISGNTNSQIAIHGGEEQDIKHNFIGLASDGESAPVGAPFVNDTGIVFRPYLSINNPNFIGGYDATDYNVIGGNSYGISIETAGNFVLNNIIGGTLTGEAISSATQNTVGISLSGNGSYNNFVGDALGGNTIIGNDIGIQISEGAYDNDVYDNHIGVSVYGNIALGNLYEGIHIEGFGTDYNKVGDIGLENVISNNDIGILINDGAKFNQIYSNLIGLSGDGADSDMGNFNGIRIEDFGTDENIIGAIGKGNFISYNGMHGINLINSPIHTTVQGNLIGFQTDTISAAGNSQSGVYVEYSAAYNMIGGCNAGQGNYVGHNGEYGVVFDEFPADNDTLFGNIIGISADGGNAGNVLSGVAILNDAGSIQIGKTAAGCSNEIAFNGENGIVLSSSSYQVKISGNSIHDNIGLGIDIDEDGTPDYTTADGLIGNNATPIGAVTSCVLCGGNTNLMIYPETSGTVTYEIFKADGAGQEGDSLVHTWTGSVIYHVDQLISMPFNLATGMQLVMTATVGVSTSEFGLASTVLAAPVQLTGSITLGAICQGDTPPSLTVTGFIGFPLWYEDAGLTTFIGAGDTIPVPGPDVNSPITHDYFVVDSIAGCVGPVSAAVTMTVSALPAANAGADEVVCGNNSNVTLGGSVTGASGGIWSGGGGTFSPSANALNAIYTPSTGEISAGLVTLTLTSTGNGACTPVTDQMDVVITPAPAVNAGVDETVCADSPDVILSGTVAVASGGVWSGGGGTYSPNANALNTVYTPSPVEISAGSVTLTLTSTGNGTCNPETDQMTITINALPTVSIATPSDICQGMSQTYSTTIGGAGPLATVWQINTDFLNATIANATTNAMNVGTYQHTLYVTDINSCVNSDSVTFNVNPLPDPGNTAVMDVSCNGGSDGVVNLAPLGSYTFLWDNTLSSTTQNLSNVPAGSYNVILTDNSTGCVTTAGPFFVNEPLPLTSTVNSQDVSCSGAADGMVSAAGGDGSGSPYGYTWYSDPGLSTIVGTTDTVISLVSGWYYVEVTDVNTCPKLDSVQVIEPAPIAMNLSISSNYNGADISCNGVADGEGVSTPTGGTAPYSNYMWVLGATTVDTDSLGNSLVAGMYSVSVTDANGCTNTEIITLTQPAPIITNAGVDTSVCVGSSVGLQAIASGGTGTITYSWTTDPSLSSTTVSNPTATPTSSNTYVVTATDVNACNQADTVEVMVNALPSISVTSTNITCNGSNDGTIGVLLTSGVSPYQYSKDNGATFSISTTVPNMNYVNLIPGPHTIVAMDQNGCISQDTVITITEPSPITLIASIAEDTCSKTVGQITLNASGGIGTPYSYSIDNGVSFVSSSVFSNLATGNYDIVAQDGSACQSVVQTISVGTIAGASLSVNNATNVSCFGSSDGSIDILVSNQPTGAMTFYWTEASSSYSATTEDIFSLSIGNYTLLAQDDYGCFDSLNVVILEPAAVVAGFIATDESCLGSGNGTLNTSSVSGGTPTYNLSWTQVGGGVVANPNAVSPGDYIGVITDVNGCSDSDTITVATGATVATPTIDQLVGASGSIEYCQNSNGTYGYITATSNTPIFGNYNWSYGMPGANTTIIDSLLVNNVIANSTWIYVFEKVGPCSSLSDSVMVNLTQNDLSIVGASEFCPSETIFIEAMGTGNIQWQGDADIQDATVNPIEVMPIGAESTYYVEMNSNGCFYYDSILVTFADNCSSRVVGNNAFSPDGDGVNDVFQIDLPLLLVNDNKVTIFNRWGDIINEFENYNNQDIAWDGKNSNGRDIVKGTYFYVIEIPAAEFKTTGWIQIVR
jgi:gliding motility-associated-like protein